MRKKVGKEKVEERERQIKWEREREIEKER